MKNQKHADVMAPDRSFEALQTAEGDSLFFSIGDDHAFYLTREARDTATGWDKVDLLGNLRSALQGAKVAAKAFDVSQNAATGAIDLALAVTVDGTDLLYLSRGNSNSDVSWSDGVEWTGVPFDASSERGSIRIAGLYVLQTPSGEFFVADVEHESTLRFVDRYYIEPDAAAGRPKWNAHDLAIDLTAGSLSSALGQRAGDRVAGIYTFGTIGGQQELVFTPLYNVFKPGIAANPARLALPPRATAIARAMNGVGLSSLFVAADGGLAVFTPDNQRDGAQGVPVAKHPLLADVKALSAATGSGKTAVWAINARNDLVYLRCPAGQEAVATAWSFPVVILRGVESMAFFLNRGWDSNVLFAHTSGQELVQMTQDPVTTEWRRRRILLPSTDLDRVVEYDSFTTHVKVTDDSNVGSAIPVSITSTSPIAVYLDGTYRVLTPTVPVRATTDAAGTLTIVQETRGLAGVCLRVSLDDLPAVSVDINPMGNALARMGSVKTGDDLGKVQVPATDPRSGLPIPGRTQSLVAADVSGADRDATAQMLQQFAKVAASLPQDGTARPAGASPGGEAQVWGVSYGGAGGTAFSSGEASADRLAAAQGRSGGSVPPGSYGNSFRAEAGDLTTWLDESFHTVSDLFLEAADGVYHFFIKLGDALHHVVLDCVNAVVAAAELVFGKIKVAFGELVKWLGFVFGWDDIVRTHDVLKNVVRLYAMKTVAGLESAKADVATTFDGLEARIDAWADIPNVPDSIGGLQASALGVPGQDSPQANYGLYHAKGNASGIDTGYQPPEVDASALSRVLKDLEGMVDHEADALRAAVERIKTEVVDKVSSLSPTDIIRKVIAIIADFALTSVENLVVTTLDVVAATIQGILDLLDAPIRIPILSPLYKRISGNDLSVLDLVCLIVAIPVTIVYKLMTDAAPFPDDAATNALIQTKDFGGLKPVVGASLSRRGFQRNLASPSSHPLLDDTADDAFGALAEKLEIVMNIAGAFGVLGSLIVGEIKWQSKQSVGGEAVERTPVRKGVNLLAAAFFLVLSLPSVPQAIEEERNEWFTVMNEAIATTTVAKTFFDNLLPIVAPAALADTWEDYVSPAVDSFLNLIWVVPAGFSFARGAQEDADKVALASVLCFDFGGIILPGTTEKYWPELEGEGKPIQKAAVNGFHYASSAVTACGGVLCLAVAGLHGKRLASAAAT